MTFPNRNQSKKKIKFIQSSCQDDILECTPTYDSSFTTSFKESSDWNEESFIPVKSENNYQEQSTYLQFDTWLKSTLDGMCPNIEPIETTNKIKLNISDLPQGSNNSVKRFKIEYLYEIYESMWNKYNEKCESYLKALNAVYDRFSKLEISPILKKTHENRLIREFERVKCLLNESFTNEKDAILREVIDTSVDKKASRILRHWFNTHFQNPFPTEEEKKALAFICNLEVKQVSTWFGNHRGRCKRKLLDSQTPHCEIPMWINSNK